MIQVVLVRLLLDAFFCFGLVFAGRAMNQRDMPREPRSAQVVNGQGMMQQVSVTLNVNPQQVKMDGGYLDYSVVHSAGHQKSRHFKKGGPVVCASITGISYLAINIFAYNVMSIGFENSWVVD